MTSTKLRHVSAPGYSKEISWGWHPGAETCRSLILVMNCILFSAFLGWCINCKNMHSMSNITVMSCSFVDRCPRFLGTCCLHLQCKRRYFYFSTPLLYQNKHHAFYIYLYVTPFSANAFIATLYCPCKADYHNNILKSLIQHTSSSNPFLHTSMCRSIPAWCKQINPC
jgi:hypothetical protein